MSVSVSEIMMKMEQFAPKSLAETWDNVGLLVGSPDKVVRRVLVTLDPTLHTIELGIKERVDLIISHHPILLRGTNKITTDSIDGTKVIRLIQNDIALISAHTNLDQVPGGVEDTLSNLIELQNPEILDVNIQPDGFKAGYGRIGDLVVPMTLQEYAERVKTKLELPSVTMTGDSAKIVKRVATACGSGSSQVLAAKLKGADVLVTGDVKYHSANDALESGIALIDATHYGTEKHVVHVFEDFLRKHFSQLEVIKDHIQKNPLQTI